MQAHWSRPGIRLIEPFVRIDLDAGIYERKHPTQASDWSQLTEKTGDDDWSAPLEEADWRRLEAFLAKFETIRLYFDFIDFTVGGESRRVWVNPHARSHRRVKRRGLNFHAPRRSLMETVASGYFDDILIGNFMKTKLYEAALYPHFTLLVAKLGGAAKVFTAGGQWRFRWRYWRRNPIGYTAWHIGLRVDSGLDVLRRLADRIGVKRPLSRVYRRRDGDPVA